MAASKYDFPIEQGSSYRMSIIYKDSDNNPINLNGWCARLIWTTNLNDIQVFTTNNTDHSQYKFTIDGLNGKLTLLFPFSTTNDFNFSTARYDLELQSPDELYVGGGSYTTRLLYGTVNIVKRYSKNSIELDCNT